MNHEINRLHDYCDKRDIQLAKIKGSGMSFDKTSF